MKPDRFEWLNQERERVEREGTGAQFVTYVFKQHAKRATGIVLATLLTIFLIQILPQTPEGPVYTRAAVIAGSVLAAVCVAALYWRKPASLALKWALWTATGMGCLLLVSPAMA